MAFVNVTVRLPPEMVKAIDQVAENNETSRGWVIRKLIREAVENGQRRVKKAK